MLTLADLDGTQDLPIPAPNQHPRIAHPFATLHLIDNQTSLRTLHSELHYNSFSEEEFVDNVMVGFHEK